MKSYSVHLFAIAIVTGFWAQGAPAQNVSMPVIQIAPDFAMSNLNRELLDRRSANQNPNAQAPALADESLLRFDVDPDARAENLRGFVDRMKANDPEGAARLNTLLASTDVMGLIANAMGSVGLDSSNVADAYAVWWISAFQASQGVTKTPPRQSYQAVRRQSANILLSTPSLVNATQVEKQQLAEAYLIQAALIDSAVAELHSNPGHLATLKTAVAEGAMASGLDLKQMELTAEGFRVR